MRSFQVCEADQVGTLRSPNYLAGTTDLWWGLGIHDKLIICRQTWRATSNGRGHIQNGPGEGQGHPDNMSLGRRGAFGSYT